MSLVLLIAALVSGQVPLLGADEFEVRERATARLDNPFAALFLPRGDADPEVNYRLRGLHTRNLRCLDAEFVERAVHRADYARWLDWYFCPGVNRITDRDAWEELDGPRAAHLRDRWPTGCQSDEVWLWWNVWSYSEFREYCDYHRGTAPQPRTVDVSDP
jgi:hypothetical protein